MNVEWQAGSVIRINNYRVYGTLKIYSYLFRLVRFNYLFCFLYKV